MAQREAAMGREFHAPYRAALVGALASRSLEELSILNATIVPNFLGDRSADLVYTPVPPCRVFDTRFSAAGILVANTQRDFLVAGIAGFPAQGGTAGGCGVPFGPATSVIINFAAVTPAGNGNLRAWAVANPQPPAPLAAVMNYGTALQALANGIAVPTCDPGATSCAAGDLRLQADVSSVHVVGDVVGFFSRFTTPLPHTEGNRITALGLTTTCQALTSCTITNPSQSSGKVLVQATVNFRQNHTAGNEDIGNFTVAANGTTCLDPFLGNSDSAWIHIDNIIPTSCCFEGSVTPMNVFTLAAGATATYFVNGRMDPGFVPSAGLHSVDSATIQCLLLR